ncbi:hypothetical protein MRB53_042396 [Persea americana]|nr:hypothetical protein MRB53_042396 [Persea americana]
MPTKSLHALDPGCVKLVCDYKMSPLAGQHARCLLIPRLDLDGGSASCMCRKMARGTIGHAELLASVNSAWCEDLIRIMSSTGHSALLAPVLSLVSALWPSSVANDRNILAIRLVQQGTEQL